MKRLALALGLLASASAAQAQSPANWTQPTEPFQIADNLYYVGTAGLSAFLITTPQGHILIDGAMPTSAKPIEASIVKLGFKPADVKVLLNTHAHFDHAGGLAELKADTGAKLAASAGDRLALETGKYIGSEDVKAFDFAPVKVDRVLKDGDTETLGGETLTAHVTPGHTAGCTTWTFPVTIGGQRHEAVLYCSTSVAANRLVSKTKGPQYPGIVADYEQSFAKLGALKADVFLAPHAEQFGMPAKRARLAAGGPNPFIDPGMLQTTVAASEKAFRQDLAKQQEAAK
ncbi:MAG: subclass B3 metallo-beta-lactamase [Phenylobacterium sp.]|uniref:subclass B3 metallo-beta-lactamase n=1 Tax=Phenylobacterium sp. TaxID=1871053 RepID=UPI0025F6F2F9|nr:subclass B3 metallo-beta-lactamase [Phenylobacterium sp.]MBA4014003.1 subclass B3 metallo-beta-lactamase [Phenylobacterium sp.]